METFKSFELDLYDVNAQSFSDIALSLFRFQAVNNPVYAAYVANLGVNPSAVDSITKIPFLPISFFKQHTIKTGEWDAETIFSSSGTTGSTTSRHLVHRLNFYLQHASVTFNRFFGNVNDYTFLALLPSYQERSDSSLIAMMDFFIRESGSPRSGYYLNDIDRLLRDLSERGTDSRKTILWGVTYALLDLAERHRPDLGGCLVFETGGMKGRRQEITREELHNTLSEALHVDRIYSEYGMTELFSQAYSMGFGRFSCPPWMKILGREITDPLRVGLLGESAGINVIDLANIHSIGFIETEDLGKIYQDGSFEIMGRMDNSDVRGCNLMVE